MLAVAAAGGLWLAFIKEVTYNKMRDVETLKTLMSMTHLIENLSTAKTEIRLLHDAGKSEVLAAITRLETVIKEHMPKK